MYFQPLNQRRRLLTLVALMVGVALLASIAIGWVLYLEAVKEQSIWLEKLARDEASLISAVARFDSENNLLKLQNTTISEIAEERGRSNKVGQTGEIVLARQEAEEIVFLLDLQHGGNQR